MIQKIKNLISDEPVNCERQYDVDMGKALMVLCLPFIHCIIECTTDEGLASGIPYLFDTIIGGPMSAPMYMFCMGIGIVYSRSKLPIDDFRRGVKLIGIFYLLNICRFLIPYLIGYMISGDTEQFITPLMYRVLGNDILLFAGMALIVIAAFSHFGLSDRAMLSIAIIMTIAGTFFNGTDVHSPLGNTMLGYLIGTEDEAGLVISDFPLLNWLIFPVCGYLFGKRLIRVKNKRSLYRIISPPAIILVLIYFPLGIYKGWGMFGEGQNCYYHMMVWDVFISLCLTIGILGVWNVAADHLPERIMSFLVETSRNITSIYCIHWVFVRTITNVILYIVRGTQILPTGVTLLLALGILMVTIPLARWWKAWKAVHIVKKPEAQPVASVK